MMLHSKLKALGPAFEAPCRVVDSGLRLGEGVGFVERDGQWID